MAPLTDLTGSTEFSIGLLVGTVVFLVALPVALGIRALVPRKGRRPGVFGPAFAIASVLAVDGLLGTDDILSVPGELVAGLALLWLGGAVAGRTPAPAVVGPLAAIPGALLVAGANQGLDTAWVPVVIVVGTAVIGMTTADLDRRGARHGLGPLLLALTIVGIYFTVPDTEVMRAVVGVTVPLVLLAWPYAAAAIGPGGAYAAVGLLLWIVAIEGTGRPGSIIGSIGAFALLVGEPAGRALAPYLQRRFVIDRRPVTRPRAFFVVGQLLLVVYASRVAGMPDSASLALLALLPALAASVAFGVFLELPERRKRRHRRKPSSPSPLSIPRPEGGNGSTNGSSNGHRRHG